MHGTQLSNSRRSIARFTGADIVGLNISDYQIKIGENMMKKSNMDSQCTFKQGDFLDMPFSDNSFDAVYAIEATCHAGNRTKCYSECLRVLKPGGLFGMVRPRWQGCPVPKPVLRAVPLPLRPPPGGHRLLTHCSLSSPPPCNHAMRSMNGP